MEDSATRTENGIARGNTGGHTGDGTLLTVRLGFRPMHIVMINTTDAVRFEKIDGMAANATFETVTAGTSTIDTTGAITLTDDGFTVSAAVNISAKNFVWFAQ